MTSLDSYPMQRTTPHEAVAPLARVRETIDLLFAPATSYVESPPPGRRWEDLEAAVGIPVDLALSGWICRVAPGADDAGLDITVTLPPTNGLPVITARATACTLCDALAEVCYGLLARIDRLAAQQGRDELHQEAA